MIVHVANYIKVLIDKFIYEEYQQESKECKVIIAGCSGPWLKLSLTNSPSYQLVESLAILYHTINKIRSSMKMAMLAKDDFISVDCC